MKTGEITCTISCRLAWWFKPSLRLLYWFAILGFITPGRAIVFAGRFGRRALKTDLGLEPNSR